MRGETWLSDINNASGDSLLTSLQGSSRPNILPQRIGSSSGMINNQVNQNSLANINLQQNQQRYSQQSDTRLMSTMNHSIEAASRQVTSAIHEQTQVVSQGLGAVAQSISQGFQSMGQLLQQLFKDRAMLVAESENLNSAMAEYSKYTSNFFSTLFEKKYRSLLSAVKEPFKGWEDVQEKIVQFMGSSDTLAKILELTPLSKVKNPTELAPFTKDLADAIRNSGKSSQVIEEYQNRLYEGMGYVTQQVFVPQYKLQTNISKQNANIVQYSAEQVKYLSGIYKILFNIYDTAYSNRVKQKAEAQKTQLKQLDAAAQALEIKKKSGQKLSDNEESTLSRLNAGRNRLREDIKSLSPATLKLRDTKPLTKSTSTFLSKTELKPIMDLNASIQKLNITTKEHLDALEKNTSEIKSQTPFSEVLSTFGMSLLNPTMWWKIMTGPLGKIAGMYGLYKLADAGVQWVKPKLTTLGATTIPGTNDKTIGSVFKSGKNVLTQYIVDPLISGMKTVFKWVLGDEWFNRIGGYLSTIKTYTVDVAHALFGDPSQKQEARSKLGKIIHDKVYQAVSALIPIIIKGIMVYRGTKLLMNPRQLLENFRTLGFGKVAGIFSRSEDKKILDAITQQKFEQAMVATKGSTIAANNIVRQGNKAYEYTPRKGILGALGLKKKTLVERDIKNSYVPTKKDFLETQGYTFDTKTLKDGRTITTGVYKNGKKLDLLHNQADMNEYQIDTGRFKNATRKFSQTGLGSRLFAAKEAVQGTKLYGWISKPFKFLGSKLGWVSKVFTFLGDKVGWLIKPLKLIGPLFSALVGPLGGILAAFSALSFYANTIAKFGKKQGDGSITGGIGKFVGNFLSNAIGQVGDVIKSGISLLPDILGGFFNGIWRFLKREGPALGRTIFIDLPIKIGEVFWEGIKWLAAQIWKPFQWLGHYISKIIPGWSYTPDWMQTSGYYLSKEFDIDKETKYGTKKDNMAYLAHTKHYGDISNTFEEITNQFKNKDKNLEEGNFSKTLLARTLQNIKDNSEDDVDIYRGAKSLYGMFEKAYLSKDEKLWKEAKKQFEKLRSQEYSVSGDSIDANLARAGLSIEYLKQFKTKEEALDKYLEVVNSDKIYKAIQKPLLDALNKEAEERNKQREAENQRLVAEEVERMKTEKSETSGSLGQLAQWFQSGAAQKFIKDSITSLGEKIKAGWEFLKNQDYKKMFGSAMEVFGGVSGSIMSTIFGDDKTNAWLDNALKYAESNNLTYAKKFLSGAKNSLKDNVAKTAVNTERTANALEKMVNGQSPNPFTMGTGSLGGMMGGTTGVPTKESPSTLNVQEYEKYLQNNANLNNSKLQEAANSMRGYNVQTNAEDRLSGYNKALTDTKKSWAVNAISRVKGLLKNTGVSLYDTSGNVQTPQNVSDAVLIGSNMTKTVEGTGTNKNDGKLGWSRVGIYAVKLPMYYNDMGPAMQRLMKSEYYDKFYGGKIHTNQEQVSGPKADALRAILNGGLGDKPDQDPRFAKVFISDAKLHAKVFERYFNPFKDIAFPVNVLLADHAYQYGFGSTDKVNGIIPTITRAAQALGAKVSNNDKNGSIKALKMSAEKNPWYTGSVLLSSMFKRSITNKKDVYGIAARIMKLGGMLGYIRNGDIFNHPYIEKTPESANTPVTTTNSSKTTSQEAVTLPPATESMAEKAKSQMPKSSDTTEQGSTPPKLNDVVPQPEAKSSTNTKPQALQKKIYSVTDSIFKKAQQINVTYQEQQKLKSSAIDDVTNLFNTDKFPGKVYMDRKYNANLSYNKSYQDVLQKLKNRQLTAEKAKELLTSKELSDSQKGDLKEYISILTQLLSTFTETYGKNDDRTVQLTNVITQLQNRQNSTNISQQGTPFMNASRNVGRQFKDRAMKK